MKLAVRGLTKSFGEKIVFTDVSFAVTDGIWVLSAPSGAGKTTLLRILAGLETADAGTVSPAPGALRIAAVFQENRLLEYRTAEENLRFVLGNAYDPTAAGAMLDALGLPVESGEKVSTYSGGMQRRLALARALLVPAELLLLDEPFTGLDEENRDRAMRAIEKRDLPTILVSHHPPKSEKAQRMDIFRETTR